MPVSEPVSSTRFRSDPSNSASSLVVLSSIASLNVLAESATVTNLPGGWSHLTFANGFLSSFPRSTMPLWWFTLVVVLRSTGTPYLSDISNAAFTILFASAGFEGSSMGTYALGPKVLPSCSVWDECA